MELVRRPRNSGSVLVWVLIFGSMALVGVLGLAQMMSSHQKTQNFFDHGIRAQQLAEAGLNRSINILKRVADSTDPVYYDSKFYNLEGAELASYVDSTFAPLINGNGGEQQIELKAPGDGSYFFKSMTNGAPGLYILQSRGTYTGVSTGRSVSKVIEASVAFLFDEERFGAAIISDMVPTGPGGGGKRGAQQGHVVLKSGDNISIIGDILANGGVYVGSDLVSDGTIDDYILYQAGYDINSGQAGTDDEIPDYTSPGSENQLFDFGRFIAAADAGAGTHYPDLPSFADAAAAGTVFKGITVIDVNLGDYIDDKGKVVKSLKLVSDISKASSSQFYAPDIHAEGTLLFNIFPTFEVNGVTYDTPDLFKLFVETDVSINPADLSDLNGYLDDIALFNTAYEAWEANPEGPAPEPPTAPSNYPVYDDPDYTGPKPWDVDISPAYENFDSHDDLPALMYTTGILDLHRGVNISGALYTPSFIEIEQKQSGTIQYISGIIIAGGGVFIESGSTSPGTVIAYDSETVDNLATMGSKMRTPRVVAWRDATRDVAMGTGMSH